MKPYFLVVLFISILTAVVLHAQSNQPLVIQAVGQSPSSTTKPATAIQTAAAVPAASDSTLKLLQDIKAANAAVLSKQAETLQQLDDLQKAADEMRIYSKRG